MAYNPAEIEGKWYEYWQSKGYFHSVPDSREAYSVVIPPPNVTGVLHMGHMLNNTIQDILIRKARMEGKNACWVPGTDHASIATEAKVVKMLREQGIKKGDLSREKFLEYAWEWKEKYGGIILEQLKKLGASCDWERTAFTMDDVRSEAVIKVFVDLFRKGKLYRGHRMVNWDPEALTVLSNEEVIYGVESSKLYLVKYDIEGVDESITIATTRPETIMGDTAIAVHPEDERYKHLQGRRALVPIIGRSIPIIADEYVDREFGTGALKVTPAHDVNDYDLGKKHNLETIDIFNDNGTMSASAQVYIGEDRFVVRKKFSKDLEAAGHIVEVKDYQNNVGRSERTQCIIEPRLSLQWYVDMKSITEPALKAVMDNSIEFFPSNQKNIYRHWMENIKDWCISRQLWWGHRIPAYYVGEDIYVAESAEEALALARIDHPDLSLSDLKQDDDVLDTWFSSWLWPISVFNGFRSRKELDYYYPTSVLVTGWDIIFLWVARMVMAGYEWENKKPFHKVYFTGMVRDKQRRKMSKQLGNSPDALKLIEDFGADGVRFGMMSCAPAGGDLLYDEKLVTQGRNFCNKLSNAFSLLDGLEVDRQKQPEPGDALMFDFMEQKLKSVVVEIHKNFEEFRLSEALMTIYNFVWDDFCSWYLEVVKPPFGHKISAVTHGQAKDLFSRICTLLHPFMPFITEELWHKLGNNDSDCILSNYPQPSAYEQSTIDKVEQAKDIITQIRDVRHKHSIKPKDALDVYVMESNRANTLFSIGGLKEICIKLANLNHFELSKDEGVEGISFISGTEKCIVVLDQKLDIESEVAEKQKELEYQRGFVSSVLSKLQNERFVNGAPAAVVEKERAKLADGEQRIKILEEEIKRLRK
jgi:valyl-tRNA synthetase